MNEDMRVLKWMVAQLLQRLFDGDADLMSAELGLDGQAVRHAIESDGTSRNLPEIFAALAIYCKRHQVDLDDLLRQYPSQD